MWAMPLISARSERGFSGRYISANIAVLVTRGSATISVWCGFVSEVLAEDRVIVGQVGADQQNDVGPLHVFVIAMRAVTAKRKLVAETAVAMQSVVLPS